MASGTAFDLFSGPSGWTHHDEPDKAVISDVSDPPLQAVACGDVHGCAMEHNAARRTLHDDVGLASDAALLHSGASWPLKGHAQVGYPTNGAVVEAKGRCC